MKRVDWVALLATVLSLGLAFEAAAQTRTGAPLGSLAARPQASGSIALIDISYIFKNHAGFKAAMENMQKRVAAAEADVKAQQESIRQAAAKLQDFKKGSPDYNTLEEELTQKTSELSVRVNQQKREFLQEEARIYHSVYQDILQKVAYYAKSHGMVAVLRFNGEQASVENPEEVLRDINKQVVWYAPEQDITPVVLSQMNQAAASQIGAAPQSNPLSRTGVLPPAMPRR